LRRLLAWVAVAVTSMVALSFLLPLGMLVYTQARAQRITAAEQRAAALAPVLALSDDDADLNSEMSDLGSSGHLAIHLPDGRLLGTSHAPAQLLAQAAHQREAITRDIPGGWVCLQPVVLDRDRVAVIESYVPGQELTRGVAASWAVMSLLAMVLIVGSVLVADRLGAQVVRSSRTLSRAANALGRGELDARVEPMGPPELRSAGRAFNAMADRMVKLLAVERELVADLSHRLRTPLTALHLAAERMGPTPEADRIAAALQHLESELGSIIAAARTPLAVSPMGRAFHGEQPGGRTRQDPQPGSSVHAAPVIRHRAGFWAVLAAQQDRPCEVTVTSEPTPVDLPEDDLVAVIDALVGNVFRHTPYGTAFAVCTERTAQAVVLTVDDAGPGIPDPDRALARGASSGSTGLGLDIAVRAAAVTRGSVRIGRGALGGARITVTLGLATPQTRRSRLRRRTRRALRRA
jgi:signal transduction histidine kinase